MFEWVICRTRPTGQWGMVALQVERPIAEEEEFLGEEKQSKYGEILFVQLIWVDTLGNIFGRSTCRPRVLI